MRSGRRRLALGGPAVLLALAGAGPGRAGSEAAELLVHAADGALAKGDGIAAEVALRRALTAGVPRPVVAARMGEAMLDQGERRKAREWLGPGVFSPDQAARGWRMLGRLEIADGNLPAAGQAFDRALQVTPRDSLLWVDIARLRYLGGEQVQAFAAANTAIRFDPTNPRALEMGGLLMRDSLGLRAALPWLEAGLLRSPDDLSLLGSYAATLGELGRARDMLIVTRRMLEIDSHSVQAFLLQAVLAARAGDVPLARSLLEHAGARVLDIPAGLLLSGMLELEAGNPHLAVVRLDQLVRRQPGNLRARLLLARALAAAGNDGELLARFAPEATAAYASPYLLTLVAQAHERRGARELAAPLLSRAAGPVARRPLVLQGDAAVDSPSGVDAAQIRTMVAQGNLPAAASLADQGRRTAPGSAEVQMVAGDVRFLHGDSAGALECYRLAAQVRFTDALLLRIVTLYRQAGNLAAARQAVASARAAAPRDRLAIHLDAGLSSEAGDWGRAARLLRYLEAVGGGRDALLAAELAQVLLQDGQTDAARQAAERGYALQRASAAATFGLGQSMDATPNIERQHLLAKVAQLAAVYGRDANAGS